MYEPGTQWRYSAAVDVQARLIEKLSGLPFETYMQQQVLEPLGMTDSAWTQPDARLSAARVRLRDWGLTRSSTPESRADLLKLNFSNRKLTMGGAGLATTADDYMRFARMLLGRGTLGGTRILKPSTIRLMSTDQLDPKMRERFFLPDKGTGGFGIDFFVRTGQRQERGRKSGRGRRILLGRRLVDPVLGRSGQQHGGGLPGPDRPLRRYASP